MFGNGDAIAWWGISLSTPSSEISYLLVVGMRVPIAIELEFPEV
jgi:hypothetical protein